VITNLTFKSGLMSTRNSYLPHRTNNHKGQGGPTDNDTQKDEKSSGL